MTSDQIKLIHVARRQVKIDEPQYRLLLRNVGGVDSSKDLGKHGLEAVMAVFEDMGFRSTMHGPTFYRDRFRSSAASPEQLHKLRQMADASRYPLAAMCRRFSAGRTDQVEQLTPTEAWQLIEMYKAEADREAVKAWDGDSNQVADEIPF
jgi:hypothetical protein